MVHRWREQEAHNSRLDYQNDRWIFCSVNGCRGKREVEPSNPTGTVGVPLTSTASYRKLACASTALAVLQKGII